VEPSPIRNVRTGHDENNVSLCIGDSEDKNLGYHRSDLPGRKVDNRQDLSAQQIRQTMQRCDLCRRTLYADLAAEIDEEPIRRGARLRERQSLGDCADPDIEFEEVVYFNLRRPW